MNNRKKLPDWLVSEVRRCLIGEIYPAIRAIAVSFNAESRYILIRYYLDREVRDADYESLEVLACEISSADANGIIEKIDIDSQYYFGLFKNIDPLDGFIYARRENDLKDVM